jgi:hypothetical protein
MRLIIILLIILLTGISQAAHVAGDIVQYETINGRQYKVVYQTCSDKLIITYFDQGDIPQGKWRIAGVEIFKEGKVIKDTFEEND